MSERLTSDWTKTAEEAYGKTGKQGFEGEVFVFNVIKSWGWECILHEDDKVLQMQGIDVEFKKPTWTYFYTADVKNNLRDDGIFFVEGGSYGWLFNTRKVSDRIWHCNPNTGWMAWYDREDMKKYIRSNTTEARSRRSAGSDLYRFSISDNLPFIKVVQEKVSNADSN